jgi:hypothetical protein
MSIVLLSGMVPQLNSHMVLTNSKELLVTLVIKEVAMVLLPQHNHQVLDMVKLVHTNKVVIPKQGMVNQLMHHQLILDNMVVVASKLVTNKVGTRVMVTVATHHQVLLRQVVMVKAMVVKLVDMVNQVVVISQVVTSIVVVGLTSEMVVVMVVETEGVMVVMTVAIVVVTIVVVMIAMATVAVVEDMVVVIVVMEGMYF